MKLLYDYDETPCSTSRGCPKFVLDEKEQKVSLVDREGNRATMKVEEFNAFVEAVVSKKVTKI